MAETMLKVTDLVSSYGNIKALKGISLEVKKVRLFLFLEQMELVNLPL